MFSKPRQPPLAPWSIFRDPPRHFLARCLFSNTFTANLPRLSRLFTRTPQPVNPPPIQKFPFFTRPIFNPNPGPFPLLDNTARNRRGYKKLNLDAKLNFDDKLRHFPGFARQRPRHLRHGSARKHKRPPEDRGQLDQLDRDIKRGMDPSSLTPEDEIFLKEMECLNIHRALRIKVVAARETVVRAAEKTPSRLQNHAARDAELNQRIEEEAAQARQREYWREQMRLAEEKRRKDMLEREEMERHERQRAREVWEAKRKQEAEIEARQHWEREEVSRVATERAYAAQVYAIDQEYQVYDTKWAQLRSGVPLDPINFCELPWPVLGPRVARPSDITYQRVQDFVFNTLRKGVEDKSRREKVRLEVLKWHPDKFDTKVLLKVVDHERQVTAEAAGIVVRILMQIMEEEVAREHDP